MYYIGNITEESEDALEEEVATVNEKYVVVQVFSHGGFLPTRFQNNRYLRWINLSDEYCYIFTMPWQFELRNILCHIR